MSFDTYTNKHSSSTGCSVYLFFTTQGKYIQAGIILVNLKYSEEKRQDSSVTKLGEFTPITYVDDCFLWAVLFDTEKVMY
jgi:hypothetical protein